MFKPDSIHFAPMEGITDPIYRSATAKLYPEWDSFCTDFLRLPSVGHYKEKHIIRHFGESIFNNPKIMQKTTLQVLAAPQSRTAQTIKVISNLGFDKINLNIGCPSKTVNGHFGGAYLLSTPENLRKIIVDIRENFHGHFSVKMRLGYRSADDLIPTLDLLNQSGIDTIILHGRTRDQLYKGVASWKEIKRAVEYSKIPVVGNGDIWNCEDIKNIQQETGCHGVMVARGALKTPWLAKLYKSGKNYSLEEQLKIRRYEMPLYYKAVHKEAITHFSDERVHLKKLKGLSRYLYDDFDNPLSLRSKMMRTRSLKEFWDRLEEVLEN